MQKLQGVKTLRPGWPVAIPAGVSLAAMVVAELTSAATLWWDVAWTSAAVSAFVGTLLASRVASEGNRFRWTLWAAAVGAWLFGQLAWDLFGLIGTPRSPNPADAGWWAFAVLVTLSVVRMRTGSRSLRFVAAAEVLPVILGAAALTFAELLPDANASMLAAVPRLSALVYPTLYVSAAVVALQALLGGAVTTVRSTPSRLVLGGIIAQAFAFIMWSEQLLDQRYHPGRTAVDPVWVLGMLAIAAGGALAARAPEREATTEEEPGLRGGILPTLLFSALLLGLLHAYLLDQPRTTRFSLFLGLLFSGLSLSLRGSLLERRLRGMLGRERSALASLADREAELARLNQQLLEDSRRDPLTGMRNRRALADELPGIEAGHRELGTPLAVALCDVDHFKAYNDHMGHLAGDQALRAVATTIRGTLRAHDRAYRFGGEELLLVLPGATAAEAVAAAERVRAAVEAAGMEHPAGNDRVLTVSIGVASGKAGYGELLAQADAALYEAKHSGRNRVVSTIADADPAVGVDRGHGAHRHDETPRHLRSMLALSRAAAAGLGPLPVLEALARLIRADLSFQVVAINLVDDTGEQLRAVVVEGDEDARQTLLGTVSSWSEWAGLLASEHVREGAVWLPEGSYEWEDESSLWTPAAAPAPDPGAWHPHDMLLLPLRGASGDVLGVASLDQPLHGRRPDDAELVVLMAVADQAGLAVEQSQRDAAGAGEAREQSSELRLAAVMLLAETLDLRDAGTARHSRTVGAYARRAALALGLCEDRVERIHAAGVLHDLGKLGIADAILYKPGALDDAEWLEIQRHPEIGAQILEHAGLPDIASWVIAHHERIDGRGYPNGLAGEEIPIEARILAVADAYEAMIADRPYRAGIPVQEACEELIRCGGMQFDATVVEAFVAALESSDEDSNLAGEPVAPLA